VPAAVAASVAAASWVASATAAVAATAASVAHRRDRSCLAWHAVTVASVGRPGGVGDAPASWMRAAAAPPAPLVGPGAGARRARAQAPRGH